MYRRHVPVWAIVLLINLPCEVEAIRPFITDDARVVGDKQVQLETWLQLDKLSLQHWIAPAVGPTDFLEFTLGAVHGVSFQGDKSYAISGPLLQGKLLLNAADPNAWPGVAWVVGSLLPFSTGDIDAFPGAFSYVALTENIGENETLLIHFNAGVVVHDSGEKNLHVAPSFGLGFQARVFSGLHGVGEVVYGDAYTGIDAAALQAGFRFIFSDYVQIDTTMGSGFAGQERPLWGTTGLRLVSPKLF